MVNRSRPPYIGTKEKFVIAAVHAANIVTLRGGYSESSVGVKTGFKWWSYNVANWLCMDVCPRIMVMDGSVTHPLSRYV